MFQMTDAVRMLVSPASRLYQDPKKIGITCLRSSKLVVWDLETSYIQVACTRARTRSGGRNNQGYTYQEAAKIHRFYVMKFFWASLVWNVFLLSYMPTQCDRLHLGTDWTLPGSLWLFHPRHCACCKEVAPCLTRTSGGCVALCAQDEWRPFGWLPKAAPGSWKRWL